MGRLNAEVTGLRARASVLETAFGPADEHATRLAPAF
jgi:hypothetical protein